MPRGGEGASEPPIAKKWQRQLTGVDEVVLPLSGRGLARREIP
jgi:hypothetical protein